MSNKVYLMGTWLNGYEEHEFTKEDEEEANDLNPTYEKEMPDDESESNQ